MDTKSNQSISPLHRLRKELAEAGKNTEIATPEKKGQQMAK